ncbi:MAG: tripartite tricarboxylate transporter permease [Bacillota bacterium]|nr:tripartite tricarboxylate transporter permease [Bacillota bacterium]
MVAAYTLDNNLFGVWLMLLFGVLGYFMKKLDYPPAPPWCWPWCWGIWWRPACASPDHLGGEHGRLRDAAHQRGVAGYRAAVLPAPAPQVAGPDDPGAGEPRLSPRAEGS